MLGLQRASRVRDASGASSYGWRAEGGEGGDDNGIARKRHRLGSMKQ